MDYQAAEWLTLARVLVRSVPSLVSQATSLPLSTCSYSADAIGSLPTRWLAVIDGQIAVLEEFGNEDSSSSLGV